MDIVYSIFITLLHSVLMNHMYLQYSQSISFIIRSEKPFESSAAIRPISDSCTVQVVGCYDKQSPHREM